ncbi:MAG TPA: hypothetical protein VIK52_12460 [Opitutaceae bacterium]
MKDKRFLELVNVYLDGEISEAETVELESEIRSSAKRMEQYRRYCRMQKACMLIAQQSRESVADSDDVVVRLPEARRIWLWGQWWRGGIYGGTAAIAATVILVISMSGPAQLTENPAPEAIDGTRTVQIPVGEFSQPIVVESRLAALTDTWTALTRLEATTFPASIGNTPQTPEFAEAPIVTEWASTSIFPERGPLEFRYRTDSFSGARVLKGQPRAAEGEVEFATFPFAP